MVNQWLLLLIFLGVKGALPEIYLCLLINESSSDVTLVQTPQKQCSSWARLDLLILEKTRVRTQPRGTRKGPLREAENQ